MKLMPKRTLLALLCLAALPATADPVFNTDSGAAQNTSNNTQQLVQYLLNLGSYLGYDLKNDPTQNNSAQVSQVLLNPVITQLTQNYVFWTLFGALPVSMSSAAGNSNPFQFIPNNTPGADAINSQANATFVMQQYSSPSSQGATITVNPLLDQMMYQQDPVSQGVLNILGTPDVSYCMNPDGSLQNPCTPPTMSNAVMSQNQVMSNLIGTLPNPQQFLSYNYNQPLIAQLNSNSLMAPLMFTTNSAQSSTSSTPNTQTPGLSAQNQAQQAANFIRYASGIAAPLTLPKNSDYSTLFLQASPPTGTKVDPVKQTQAQGVLNTYFTNLRIFAAQTSVGLGNMYYILSKRLPQNPAADGKNAVSEALSEFNMATWRLYNPAVGANGSNGTNEKKQWIEEINAASPATVQKEIAILLAEINYQMYLDRQIQERILLTNSVMLMQNTKAGQPTADFATQSAQ